MIRASIAIALMTLTLALAACGAKRDTVTAPPLRTVTLMLDFPVNADHVGILTAKMEREFSDVGIDLKIKPPTTPAEPLQALRSGAVDLAISYEPELLLESSPP